MVVARTKLMIQDDLLRPRALMTISFKGPDPEKFYREIPALLISAFKAHEDQIQEKKFAWHKGEPDRFKIDWELNKDLDRFSYYHIEIKLEGHTEKKQGIAEVTVAGTLRTEYSQDTFWEKSLLYEFLRMTWHQFFYAPKRDGFIREGRRIMSMFIDDLKKLTR